MNELTLESVTLLLCFVLRLGLPLAVMGLLVWGLRRLDDHWQAEAAAEAARRSGADSRPCWEVRLCPPDQRATCPVYTKPSSVPCWQRLRQGDHVRPLCLSCPVWRQAQGLALAMPA